MISHKPLDITHNDLCDITDDSSTNFVCCHGLMARTKAQVLADRRTAQQRVYAAARKSAGIRKAAHILSSQELAVLPPIKQPVHARALSETEEGSETEPEDGTFSTPEPEHVIKLSAQPCGNGSRFQWRGRLRGGGADVYLECAWVRKNFKPYVRPRPNSA